MPVRIKIHQFITIVIRDKSFMVILIVKVLTFLFENFSKKKQRHYWPAVRQVANIAVYSLKLIRLLRVAFLNA